MARRNPYYGRDYDRERYGRDYERDRTGRRYDEERGRVYEFRPQRHEERGSQDRGWWDRTRDEVASWFGDEEAERRKRIENRDYRRGYESFEDIRAVDVMSRNIACARPNDPVEEVARMMAECDCGAIPVVDRDDRIIGMITDRDITVRLVGRGVDVRRARVEDAMTEQVYACHVYDSVEKCMREMARHQIRRLPIVDDRDRVVGIVSQADLARHAGSHPGYGERRAMADTLYEVSEPTDRPYR